MFINNLNPVAIEFFSIEIRWYSLAYIVGILIGWFYCKKILIKNGFKIDSAEEIIQVRDVFIKEHSRELFEDAVTLCHKHHLRLHSIYGKRPKFITAKKQPRWVEKQREKTWLGTMA